MLFVHLQIVWLNQILSCCIYCPVSGGSSMQWYPVWRLYRPLGGLPCDVWQRKVLDIAIDEVLGALSMHVRPLAIQTVVIPAGVTGSRSGYEKLVMVPGHSWVALSCSGKPKSHDLIIPCGKFP
jgi:hypothetical protein